MGLIVTVPIAVAQNSQSSKTTKSVVTSVQHKKAFIGIYYTEVKWKSNNLEDFTTSYFFQNCSTCNIYPIKFRCHFSYSTEPKPCKLIGYLENNSLICDSIFINFEEKFTDSIMMKYSNNCKKLKSNNLKNSNDDIEMSGQK